MKNYARLVSVAFFIALLAGCSTVSGILPSSSSESGSEDNGAVDSAETVAPEDTFLASDDYTDGDEIVGVFLTQSDYAKMREDFARQDVEFDWGWAAPGLDVSQYSTVHITVENDSSALNPAVEDYVRESFALAMKRLGLEPVSSGADLELDLAVVDYSSEYTYAFVTMIHPFVEIELRLQNRRTGKDLLLIRNQEHSATPKTAAAEYASDLWQALR